jgi:cytochrome c oxidase subunit 4
MSDDKPEADKPETTGEETKAAEHVEAAATSEAADHDKPTPEADEAEPTDSERSALQMTAKPKSDKPTRDGTAQENHGHGHAGDHAHGDGHDHGLAHTTPVWLLFGVLGALLVLTIATVAVTSIDLGAQNNLIVAMVIATIKAALVCTFFMHLLWDKKFNAILFLTSVLFLILFLSMTSTDRGEYQHLVDEYRAAQLAPK